MANEVDMINHPPHYRSPATCRHCGGSIQCIDITRHMGFALGNAVKYIWRVAFGGKANDVEDLGKSVFYVNDEIAKRSPKSKRDENPETLGEAQRGYIWRTPGRGDGGYTREYRWNGHQWVVRGITTNRSWVASSYLQGDVEAIEGPFTLVGVDAAS